MKIKQNPRTKSTFLLTFCLLFCWATAGITADHIQLRKYPSPDGLLLDTIQKGQKVKIIETFGSWRYILVEGSTYGGGWVHFKDLEKGTATDQKTDATTKLSKTDVRKASSPKKQNNTTKKPSSQHQGPDEGKNNPKPSFHSKVSVGTVKIHQVAIQKEARKTEPDRQLKNNPEPEPEKTPPMALIKTAHANPLPKTTVPPNKVQNSPVQDPKRPAAMAKGAERSNASSHADNTRSFSHQEKATYQGSMRDFLNFGFRVLSVILSCLAIIFAYKAKKMAAMSYQLAVQLQQSIETHRRREFDDQY